MTFYANRLPALISALLFCSSLSPAHAIEGDLQVKIKVQNPRDCQTKKVLPFAGRDAVMRAAKQKFAASDTQAEALADDWENFVADDPDVTLKPRYKDGVCHAGFVVETNDAAIFKALNQTAFCQRPVAILTRVNLDDETEASEPLSLQAHQYLLDDYVRRSFAVVDVSEQTDRFRQTIRNADSCAYVGGSLTCEQREFTLSESILTILRSTDTIIEYYNDENIRGEKYLPLAEDGVLNFVSFEVAPERMRVRVTATVNSFRISDRDIAWAIPPQSVAIPTRTISPDEAVKKAFDRISEKVALESARRCSQS